MARSMTIFCDARRIDFRIFSEGCQRVVARDNHTNIGVSSDSTCLVQGLVGVVGALYVLRITEVNVSGCLVRHRIATLGSQARSIGAVIGECHPSRPGGVLASGADSAGGGTETRVISPALSGGLSVGDRHDDLVAAHKGQRPGRIILIERRLTRDGDILLR